MVNISTWLGLLFAILVELLLDRLLHHPPNYFERHNKAKKLS